MRYFLSSLMRGPPQKTASKKDMVPNVSELANVSPLGPQGLHDVFHVHAARSLD